MTWFLYLIGAAWVVIGACMILYTTQTRSFTNAFLAKTHPIALALMPMISGILFFMAASATVHPWIIRTLGMLGLLKSVIILINPRDLQSKIMKWYLEVLSDQAHRFFGILTVILGTAVLSWIS